VLTRDGSIAELFMELVAVPSPSGRERAVGEAIRAWLAACGIDARFDDAGAVNGSDAGNLIARVPGAPDAPALLFVAHMDTVETGTRAVAPVLGPDGVIRSDGETILGADNKAAVAAVMRVCRLAAELPSDRRPTVVAAFTCREEAGRMGASLLDVPALGVDCVVSVDGAQPIGTIIARALGQTTFVVTVRGRAAHAAANPEAGVNAIAVAGEVAAALPLGRQAHGGSANVAAIVGGSVIARADGGDARAAIAASPTNSVPDVVHLKGEVRGYSVEAIEETMACIEAAIAQVCEARGARFELVRDRDRMVPPLPGAAESRALARVREAAVAEGIEVTVLDRQATLEANYLAAAGADVAAVASGGRDPHQLTESIPVAELERLEALLARIVSG
jgi:tripeptide aminopeptidase